MDEAFNQHSSQARRKNRSSASLHHLTLAPLTSKLPITDPDAIPDTLTSPHQYGPSYLQRKSAPTTPRLLARSPARSPTRTRPSTSSKLPKSKSASHLAIPNARRHVSGTISPNSRRKRDDAVTARDRSDSDWLLRTGALISSETREFKGQSWLVSRESSTSLTGMWDAEEEAIEREMARERGLTSRRASRRGSITPAEDDHSSKDSRHPSRSHSRAGSRVAMFASPDRIEDGYFPPAADEEDYVAGPDFVNLDEKLEAISRDTDQDDEATVRRLVRQGNAAEGSWVGSLLGWSLFSVEENDEESDVGDGDLDVEQAGPPRRSTSMARLSPGVTDLPEDRIPPPTGDEGAWKDAAWLLSVATKVLL